MIASPRIQRLQMVHMIRPLSCLQRALSTTPSFPSAPYLNPSKACDPAVSATPDDLSPAQRHVLDSALRVDQAGEVAANWIYRGQMSVLGRDPKTGPIIQDMWDQEKKHIAVMNKLQIQHQVRQTILWEVAKVAGFGLGAVTALMGKEAAMACTEAVETVIGEHYDEYAMCLLGVFDPPDS
ncbi:COQ7-domain-containing protein [Heliocybe sulcata]|uniref:COQ7-domain-containing protein n=1 Tax=Heliocybe sulcata TaxID=5364 RepID=A0A5C3NGX3_9AGAM|nr:COQ7-domain-containing protein [Heliocybe sulcata]